MKLLRAIFGGGEPAALDRLRAAIADRDAALVEVENASAAVTRVEAVIAEARAAKRRALNARAEAADAARLWAQAGADPDAAQFHQHLAGIATATESSATEATQTASAATDALPTVRAQLVAAESELANLEQRIADANGVQLAERLIADRAHEAEMAARVVEEFRMDALGLKRAVWSWRVGWRAHHQRQFDSEQARALLDEALARCTVRDPHDLIMINGSPRGPRHADAELETRTTMWRERLERSLREGHT
jgi:hypothetical protein